MANGGVDVTMFDLVAVTCMYTCPTCKGHSLGERPRVCLGDWSPPLPTGG